MENDLITPPPSLHNARSMDSLTNPSHPLSDDTDSHSDIDISPSTDPATLYTLLLQSRRDLQELRAEYDDFHASSKYLEEELEERIEILEENEKKLRKECTEWKTKYLNLHHQDLPGQVAQLEALVSETQSKLTTMEIVNSELEERVRAEQGRVEDLEAEAERVVMMEQECEELREKCEVLREEMRRVERENRALVEVVRDLEDTEGLDSELDTTNEDIVVGRNHSESFPQNTSQPADDTPTMHSLSSLQVLVDKAKALEIRIKSARARVVIPGLPSPPLDDDKQLDLSRGNVGDETLNFSPPTDVVLPVEDEAGVEELIDGK
ncbi:hypothetical protein HDU85_003402 [Gaertneriomyces sp. JEL0708]|nr:hypothetical protein HDU85_003402 [Gaertneriomyces sp. JEL0708]